MTRPALLLACLLQFACTRERDPDPPPLSAPARAMDSPRADAPDPQAAERALLNDLAVREADPADPAIGQALGALAEHYRSRGAGDEASMIHGRMLARVPPGPGPAPGGPFPRIGLPNHDPAKLVPPTLLGRWLNARVVPELYQRDQVTPGACEAARRDVLARAAPGTVDAADAHARLAEILAAQARIRDAIAAYETARAIRLRLALDTAALDAELAALTALSGR